MQIKFATTMHKFSVLRVHLLSFQLARITALAFQVPTLSTIRSKSTSIKHFQRDCRIWLDNYTDSEDKVYQSFESRNSVIGNNSCTEIQVRRCLCRGSNIYMASQAFGFSISQCLNASHTKSNSPVMWPISLCTLA